jgi:hypothetical protein
MIATKFTVEVDIGLSVLPQAVLLQAALPRLVTARCIALAALGVKPSPIYPLKLNATGCPECMRSPNRSQVSRGAAHKIILTADRCTAVPPPRMSLSPRP